jgi:hypothetical protein
VARQVLVPPFSSRSSPRDGAPARRRAGPPASKRPRAADRDVSPGGRERSYELGGISCGEACDGGLGASFTCREICMVFSASKTRFGQQPVGDTSQGVEIRAAVHELVHCDLRGCEGRRPSHEPRRGQSGVPRLAFRAHETEVEHLDEVDVETHAAGLDVRRLDVPVHEPAGVRFGERATHLLQEMDDAFCRLRSEMRSTTGSRSPTVPSRRRVVPHGDAQS